MRTFEKILLGTVLFIVLFYDEDAGLNVGILGSVFASLVLFTSPRESRNRTVWLLYAASVVSAAAFAFYADFASMAAMVMSLALLSFRAAKHGLKSLLVVPVFALTAITFPFRLFKFDQWLPKKRLVTSGSGVLAVAVVPMLFLILFAAVYSAGSAHFENFFANFHLNMDFQQTLILGCFGLFFSFCLFNFFVPDFIFKVNHQFKNDFLQEDYQTNQSAAQVNFFKKGGKVTFILLSILLLVFILTYTYEQFYETQLSPAELSRQTHERVGAVMVSIAMAVGVILFYFRKPHGHDKDSKLLKKLAGLWLVLNALLVASAFATNLQYIHHAGLTYKRLGVIAFIILALLGLYFAWRKIEWKKTNAYIFNQMVWYFYGTVLACSVVNWGALATRYNLQNEKGDLEFLETFNYNNHLLKEAFPDKNIVKEYRNPMPNETFLSDVLYYQLVK